MTSITDELVKVGKLEYLETMSSSELAFWLIHSFSPDRYRAGNNDVIQPAIKLLYEMSIAPLIIVEFYERLWGMFGLKPDPAPHIFSNNVVQFKRNVK